MIRHLVLKGACREVVRRDGESDVRAVLGLNYPGEEEPWSGDRVIWYCSRTEDLSASA